MNSQQKTKTNKAYIPRNKALQTRNLNIHKRYNELLEDPQFGSSKAAYDQLNKEYSNMSRNSLVNIVSRVRLSIQS